MPEFPLLISSEVDSNFNLEEPKIAFQVSKTQITSITGATEYPKLRKPPVGQSGELDIEQKKIQKCPFCCEALPRAAIVSKNAWKKHLSGDVRPYTCISDNCPSPFALHSTRAEWEDHMKKEHPKKWKCQLCDSADSSLFSKVDELVEHVRRKHTDSFLEEDLEAVQLWPSTFTIGLDTCPLCRSAGPLDHPTLVDHVLEHTHEFALLSLPWADLPTEGLTIPDFFDFGCLKPVEPIFLSSLSLPSSQRDGHSSEGHALLCSIVEPSTTAEPVIQPVQSPMLTWLDGLDVPGPEERDDSVAVLKNLKDSRTDDSSNRRDDHFARSPYFASDSNALTEDAHFSRDPSFASESEDSTQDSQRDGSSSSSAWAEEEVLEVREIWDHGEALYYDDFPPQRRRIPDPEKWTQVDDLISEIRLTLDAARVRYKFDGSKNFIPRSKFADIMKPQKVLELVHGLECFQDKPHEQKQQIAQDICFGSSNQRPSLKILGALVASKQVGDLARHLQSGLTDGCLPLIEDDDNKFHLRCQCSNLGHTAVINDPNAVAHDREVFADWTKKFIAPYIRYQRGLGLHCHYIFENGICLPIQSNEEVIPGQRNSGRQSENDNYGSFDEVFKVKFYDCHCRFEDTGMPNSRGYYALKKLTSHELMDFELELSSLLFSEDHNCSREHMIKVIATFEEVNPGNRQSTYFLLFDWAEGNLEHFWQSNMSLVQDKSHCLWMAEQFLGLGKALRNVHNSHRRSRLPHRVVDFKSHGGRHGNIKPASILLFRPRGVEPLLALAGFGLGSLSRSKQELDIQFPTLTYRPPEVDLPGGLVGPRSDVYSLGCVFLEYITWFLRGLVLDRFSDERLEKDTFGFETDTFFTLGGNEQKIAVIKPAVKRWIESLKEEEACSRYLIHMLDLIETRMIQVGEDNRISARALVRKLETLKRACQRTPSFYTENWKR